MKTLAEKVNAEDRNAITNILHLGVLCSKATHAGSHFAFRMMQGEHIDTLTPYGLKVLETIECKINNTKRNA
jgi:hypothetical protein